MRKKLFYIIGIFLSLFITQTVHADGNMTITLSCPSTAKPNVNIQCNIYANIFESDVVNIAEHKIESKDSLATQNFSIDNHITVGKAKNIGTINLMTLKAGTGTVTVSFKAEFEDETSKILSASQRIKIDAGAVDNNAKVVSTFLKGIKVSSGKLSPEFSKDVYSYVIKLDKTVDKITIEGIKEDNAQTITGEVKNVPIKFGVNNYSLVVSNGSNQRRTYGVIVVREDNRDANSKLASLSVNPGGIIFDPAVLEYRIKVLNNVNEITVLATPEKGTSTVNVEGNKNLKDGENTITVKVTAEKGNQTVYKIKVDRLAEGETLGDNANIQDIKIKGYNLKFDYDKEKYSLVIGKEKKLNIKVIMEDKNATYKITGNENIEDGTLIKIITQSLDGQNSKTYEISITKPNYTFSYIATGILLGLVILIPLVVYIKYVKEKKQTLDVNGYKDDKAYHDEYVKTTIIGSNNNNQIGQNITPGQVPSQKTLNQYINQNNTNQMINNEPQVADYKTASNMANNKCPNCGRELLGTPKICPYCNMTLR